jgi:hypothetical protein
VRGKKEESKPAPLKSEGCGTRWHSGPFEAQGKRDDRLKINASFRDGANGDGGEHPDPTRGTLFVRSYKPKRA